MTAGLYQFNPSHAEVDATLGGRRRIALICPTCRVKFAINPGRFAQAKRQYPNSPIRCSDTCRRAYDRATKAAQRAEAQG